MPHPRTSIARDADYLSVLRCLAANPGWVNHIIALELAMKRRRVQECANAARKELSIVVSRDACTVTFKDYEQYARASTSAGVQPLPPGIYPREMPTPDGRVIGLRDNPYSRRAEAPPETTDTLVHLLRLLRDAMRRQGICRVTISPDSASVGRIVDTPLL